MVARVEASYNVLALFKALKGDSSASTAAADAIIEQVRKINAAASAARLQGASAATEAWFAQADTEAEWVRLGDIDVEGMRSRFGNAGEYAIFTSFFKGAEPERRIEKSTVESLVEGSKNTYYRNLMTQYYSDKARDGGSNEVRDLIDSGDNVEWLASALAKYNWYSMLVASGNDFISEKADQLANTTDAATIKTINTDLEIANGIVAGKQAFIDNFQTYLDYATWSWQAGAYNLSGSLYNKNEDGTYSPGVFEITLKGGSAVYWTHDGSGTALRSNPFGTEYYKFDLLYTENHYKKYSYQSVEERIDHLHENYPYRVVRDGKVMYSSKPTADAVKI
ncbi:hypothetical protein [Azorhizobium sp. AG788]|uniref:hypothetical protein n=1 Tax=Azorhizobium sp. AG788 TaxID=2183897 RepID=UPI003139566D